MPSKRESILLGAAVYAVASIIVGYIGLNAGQPGQYVVSVLCCLMAVIGPATAVWHYTSTNGLTVPAGVGAQIGAIVIVLGGLVNLLVGWGLQAAGVYPSDAEMLDRQRDQMLSQGLEPEAVESALKWGEMSSGVMGSLLYLVVLAVIGAIAGAVAAAVFKKGPAGEADF